MSSHSKAHGYIHHHVLSKWVVTSLSEILFHLSFTMVSQYCNNNWNLIPHIRMLLKKPSCNDNVPTTFIQDSPLCPKLGTHFSNIEFKTFYNKSPSLSLLTDFLYILLLTNQMHSIQFLKTFLSSQTPCITNVHSSVLNASPIHNIFIVPIVKDWCQIIRPPSLFPN